MALAAVPKGDPGPSAGRTAGDIRRSRPPPRSTAASVWEVHPREGPRRATVVAVVAEGASWAVDPGAPNSAVASLARSHLPSDDYSRRFPVNRSRMRKRFAVGAHFNLYSLYISGLRTISRQASAQR